MKALQHLSSTMMAWASRLNGDISLYNKNPEEVMKSFIEVDIRSLREAIDLIEEEIPDFEPKRGEINEQ